MITDIILERINFLQEGAEFRFHESLQVFCFVSNSVTLAMKVLEAAYSYIFNANICCLRIVSHSICLLVYLVRSQLLRVEQRGPEIERDEEVLALPTSRLSWRTFWPGHHEALSC